MEDHDLARLTGQVAADLESRGYSRAGVVRQAARALLYGGADTDDGCRGCGAPLTQPDTGRPRKWCHESCRRQYRP